MMMMMMIKYSKSYIIVCFILSFLVGILLPNLCRFIDLLLHLDALSDTHTHTHTHTVGLFWKTDQPVA